MRSQVAFGRSAARGAAPRFLGLGTLIFALQGLGAQQAPPAAGAGAGKPVPAQAEPGTATPAAATAPAAPAPAAFATLLADHSTLRCWPTSNSPGFPDELVKGMVVGVGRTEGDYRQVLLPLGPTGFVHRNFTTPLADGKVATKGKAVAFRFRRPKSGEAPVQSLSEGTELWVVGAEDEWWRVRCPAAECWLPAAELQAVDPAPETMVKAYAELEKVQKGEVASYLAGLAEARQEQEREKDRREKLLALQDRLAAELKKATGDQALAPIAAAAEELLREMPAESAVRPSALELQRRIAAQQWVVEATAVRDAQPVPPKDLQVPAGEVHDPLERFQAVGFLRWEKGLTGPGRYVVEKGGQRLYIVSCSSGRYELGLFVGKEVGLTGSRRRPVADSLRVLDAEKVEVLSAARR